MSGRLIEKLHKQDGMILPTTMWVMFVMLLVGGSAATTAISASSESRVDRDTKQAIAAADAAVNIAIERLNSQHFDNGSCPIVNDAGAVVADPTVVPGAGAWCPVSQPEPQENGTTTSYRISTGTGANTGGCSSGTAHRTVVGLGTSNGRKRAVATTLATLGGPVFKCALVAMDDVILQNEGTIYGDIGTNGRLRAIDQWTRVCGNVTASVNQIHTGGQNCTTGNYSFTQVPAEAGFARPSPPIPAFSGMDNGRITQAVAGCGASSDCDVFSGDNVASKVVWNPGARELTLKGNIHLNLTGKNYMLCYLRIQDNAQLTISLNHSVQIYMDSNRTNSSSPCNFGITKPISLADNGTIVNENVHRPSTLAIIGLGTPGTQPGQNDNDCGYQPTLAFREYDGDSQAVETIPMVINAPAWCARIAGGLVMEGSIIAQRLIIFKQGVLKWNDEALTYSAPAASVYVRLNDWRTCKPIANPNAFDDTGCTEQSHPQ